MNVSSPRSTTGTLPETAGPSQHGKVSEDAANPEPVTQELLAYGVVANVAVETAQGEGGLEIRPGLRHFSPGAKVWVLPPQWGDGGEKVLVVGRHRGSAGHLIRIIVYRRHLTNYRVAAVYSPAVFRALTKPWRKGEDYRPRLWKTREEAAKAVEYWQRTTIEARFDDDPWGAIVDDPPPVELQHKGKTYHLAHFNARRALYSSQPPPIEYVPD